MTRVAEAQSSLPPIVVSASPPTSPAAEVLRGYVGATFAATAAGGLDDFVIGGLGGDVFAGMRLSRWISIEGFFGYQFAMAPVREPTEGIACSGNATDDWTWQIIGARFWLHVVHGRHVDVSVGPTIGAGFSQDRHRRITAAETCVQPQDFSGWAFDGGIATALEVRPAPWFGLRAMGQTSILGGNASHPSFGAAAISVWVGPVFRF